MFIYIYIVVFLFIWGGGGGVRVFGCRVELIWLEKGPLMDSSSWVKLLWRFVRYMVPLDGHFFGEPL